MNRKILLRRKSKKARALAVFLPGSGPIAENKIYREALGAVLDARAVFHKMLQHPNPTAAYKAAEEAYTKSREALVAVIDAHTARAVAAALYAATFPEGGQP